MRDKKENFLSFHSHDAKHIILISVKPLSNVIILFVYPNFWFHIVIKF